MEDNKDIFETENNKAQNVENKTDNNNNEQVETEDNIQEESKNAKDKKGKFKFQDKKLKEELADANAKIAELEDKYMRIVAEYSNYKKRTAKEKIELRDSVKSSMLSDFLPVIDDIERAMQHINDVKDVDATIEGITLINQKFMDFLRSQELLEIEAKGQEFNTDFHEAVTQIPVQDETQKGKVIDVIQKGYTINGKVVRYSKVVVGA